MPSYRYLGCAFFFGFAFVFVIGAAASSVPTSIVQASSLVLVSACGLYCDRPYDKGDDDPDEGLFTGCGL